MSEEISKEETIDAVAAPFSGKANIRCFVCGHKVSVTGCVPGTKTNCPKCETSLDIPDENVLKKMAVFEAADEQEAEKAKEPEKTKEPEKETPVEVKLEMSCKSCSVKIDVTDKKEGSRFSCSDCGMVLKVPSKEELLPKDEKDKVEEVKPIEFLAHRDANGKVKIFCHGCNSKIDITKQDAGTRFSCPSCGVIVTVPNEDQIEDKSSAASGKSKEKVKTESKDSTKEESSKESAKSATTSEEKDSKSPQPEDKLKINCHTCQAKIDLTGEEPFKVVNCPACNAAFQVPKRFKHFLLEERLGESKNFSVYRALDLTLSREVCLKVMSKELSQDKVAEKKFLAEAARVALLSDPNIVPIYSSGEHEGCSYLVMQYMGASSLAPYLEKANGMLPLTSVYRCIRDAAKGLHGAFAQGVSHDNISLKNILVDGDGHVKVSDFGFSYSLFNIEKDKDKFLDFFAPHYMSREMVKTGENTLLGDIYSLGAVFYHLITGVAPFPGSSKKEMINQRLERSPVVPHNVRREIPENVSEFIMLMMSENAADRPGSFKEVSAKMELYLKKAKTPKKSTTPTKAISLSSVKEVAATGAGVAAAVPEEEPKKLPLQLIGGVAAFVVLLIVIISMMGGKKPEERTRAGNPNNTMPNPITPIVDPQVNPVGPNACEPFIRTDDAFSPLLRRGYPVKLATRPMPKGIAFNAYKAKMADYILSHEGESLKQEEARFEMLKYIKPYIEKMLTSVPYEGKIYARGKTLEGKIFSADIKNISFRVNDQELSFNWQLFDVRQFVEILKYYIDLRQQQKSSLSGEFLETVKRDLAYDYFCLALLIDWYKYDEDLSAVTKDALENNPSLRPQLEALIPSMAE